MHYSKFLSIVAFGIYTNALPISPCSCTSPHVDGSKSSSDFNIAAGAAAAKANDAAKILPRHCGLCGLQGCSPSGSNGSKGSKGK
ncbi:hypothetical protein MCOR25_001231 [Pyricularia grisea]|uniref:Uncharacterized protein n=1 Tax=Pyricularia grisea TaxID=148305 RepID=A0A6P8BJB2_PYRGI|nr:uncharacterized protein PgNI_00765 [Pyricularia grisea]KAI6381297.1 hypothetical protein MCOR25_001231 [Pyricularia grisea]TLD16878.1 hypothetical protein PgNI_00765 [Pyricularia grisea]